MSFTNGQDSPLLQFRKGDSKAFSNVFDYFYPALCFFAYRLLSDKEEAEDIVQDTFIKFLEQGEFVGEKPIRSWLYITTRNKCLNHLKITGRQKDALAEMNQEETDDFVLNQMTRAEVLRQLKNAIDALPPKCAEIFKLHFLEQHTLKEIAKRLRISLNTVKNQLARGKELLRKRIDAATLLAVLTFFPNLFD